MRWVVRLDLDLDEPEVVDLLTELHQRLGARVRSRTVQAWLYEAERAPVPPMGKRVYGSVRQARFRRGAGARDSS